MTKSTDEVGMLVFTKYIILEEETIDKILRVPNSANILLVLVLLRLNISIKDMESKTGLDRSEVKIILATLDKLL